MLVGSADAWNRSRIASVTCVTITTTLRLGEVPIDLVHQVDAGLRRALELTPA